jgi:hypothetical protein
MRSVAAWTASIASVLLLSGCAALVAGADSLRGPSFGERTQAAWCEALLGVDLTAGEGDTEETIEGVADMIEVVWILCRDFIDE